MSDSDLLAAYRATTWRVTTPHGEFRVRLSDPALPLCSLGIITAYNPASIPCAEHENQAANRRLREELDAAGATTFPAVAQPAGPDADAWTEPGFAVAGLSRAAVIALGTRYGQNAIVWIDSEGRPSLVVTRPGFGGRETGDPI